MIKERIRKMNRYMLFAFGLLAGCSDYEIIKRDVGDVFIS